MNHINRVVVLVDMDCFYCQVEENLNPQLKEKPIAVVQYNEWKGGGIIAVNYCARDLGVTRHMRGDDAKKICPGIELVKVPQLRGKADLTKYREAGKRVAEVLQSFTPCLERASVDEAYLDITEAVEKIISKNNYYVTPDNLSNTFVVGNNTEDFIINVNKERLYNENNLKLAVGGMIVEEIREQVFKITGYKCSAGIAHNKILAKLVCGLHKPNKQTILPQDAVPHMYADLPIKKIRNMGGKFGEKVSEILNIVNMGDLIKFSERELAKKFDEKTAIWLFNIARGIHLEPVNTRLVSKSIGCCKRFPGKSALLSQDNVEHWLNELAMEIFERLEKDLKENNRRAKQMTVSFAQENSRNENVNSSRTLPLNSYEQPIIFKNALQIIRKNCLKSDGSYNIKFLGVSVGNFEKLKKVREITSFFKIMEKKIAKKESFKVGVTPEIKNKNILKDVENCELEKLEPLDSEHVNKSNYQNEILHTIKIKYDVINKQTIHSDCTNDFKNDYEPLDVTHTYSVKNKHTTLFKSLVSDYTNILNMDSDSEDRLNLSNFSHTTEEGEIEYNNLVYFEEMYPESILDQSFACDKNFENCINISSEDSLCKEMFFNGNSSFNADLKETVRPSLKSFFNTYFDDSVNSNFDTSKALEEYGKKEIIKSNSKENIFLKEMLSVENVESKKECTKCGKLVEISQFQSHMDYHLAINIVRDEAYMHQAPVNKVLFKGRNVSVTKDSKCTSKYQKRKASNIKSKPILAYFKNGSNEIREDYCETCKECKKLIQFENINIHKDFHAAKKLHLEINSVKLCPKDKALGSKFKNKYSILKFFKS